MGGDIRKTMQRKVSSWPVKCCTPTVECSQHPIDRSFTYGYSCTCPSSHAYGLWRSLVCRKGQYNKGTIFTLVVPESVSFLAVGECSRFVRCLWTLHPLAPRSANCIPFRRYPAGICTALCFPTSGRCTCPCTGALSSSTRNSARLVTLTFRCIEVIRSTSGIRNTRMPSTPGGTDTGRPGGCVRVFTGLKK